MTTDYLNQFRHTGGRLTYGDYTYNPQTGSWGSGEMPETTREVRPIFLPGQEEREREWLAQRMVRPREEGVEGMRSLVEDIMAASRRGVLDRYDAAVSDFETARDRMAAGQARGEETISDLQGSLADMVARYMGGEVPGGREGRGKGPQGGFLDHLEAERAGLAGLSDRVEAAIATGRREMLDPEDQAALIRAQSEELIRGIMEERATGLADIASQRNATLTELRQGEMAALEASVQGAHGNYRANMAKVEDALANGQLTEAQATQMRMGQRVARGMATGQASIDARSKYAGAIASTSASFAQLSAGIHQTALTEMGKVSATSLVQEGAIRVQGIAEYGEWARHSTEMRVEAERLTAEIGAQLLATEAHAEAAYNTSVIGYADAITRAQDVMDQNTQWYLETFPTPSIDWSTVGANHYMLLADIHTREVQDLMLERGWDLAQAAAYTSSQNAIVDAITLMLGNDIDFAEKMGVFFGMGQNIEAMGRYSQLGKGR
jgi:hypothetical protein